MARAYDEYLSEADVRERNGYADDVPTDEEIQLQLKTAIQLLEDACGCWWYPRTLTKYFDGTGCPYLWLDIPLYSITSVTVDDAAVTEYDKSAKTGDFINKAKGDSLPTSARHQWNPHLVLVPASYTDYSQYSIWPQGLENVKIVGSWGWTDEDGDPPEMILKALCRMVDLLLDPPSDDDAVERMASGAIKSESVKGRSISFGGRDNSSSAFLNSVIFSDPLVATVIRLYSPAGLPVVSQGEF